MPFFSGFKYIKSFALLIKIVSNLKVEWFGCLRGGENVNLECDPVMDTLVSDDPQAYRHAVLDSVNK